ncbi:transposase (fragment) [Xenorhabdus cabanillasii JM26]
MPSRCHSGNVPPLSQKIHIILDGAFYYRTELVKDIAVVLNIELHYLPPYSPNLNPAERLWKYMNEHVCNNHYLANPIVFHEEIHHFFNVMLKEKANELIYRLNDIFQILNPASSS